MTPEAKAALLARLQGGRAKTKAARAEAKEKGLPDPKPRKARKDKKAKAADANMTKADIQDMVSDALDSKKLDKKEAIDPTEFPAAREGVRAPRPISSAKNTEVNQVAGTPINPEETKTSKIDVPNLPDKASRKKIVKDAEVVPEVKGPKDLSTTGGTKRNDVNELIVNEETGSQVISAQFPGQKESIKKALKANKKLDKPEAPSAVPNPMEKTTKSVIKHVPDVQAIEARAPFSFSAVRKMLYQ
jgi:hypothetical protein